MRAANVLWFLLLPAVAFASEASELEAFAAKMDGKLRAARYMEQNCQPADHPEWIGFETQRCTYSVKDRASGASKTATVIMLNPSALKLAEWIMNACTAVQPNRDRRACAERVFRRVLVQSGGQFPVAGVVYEDILPADGVYEAYAFRDGVTTIVEGFPHRGTERLTTGQIEKAQSGRALRTASKSAYARPIGVTRSDYQKANPDSSVDGLDWLKTVRAEYQRAWRSERNALIEAWLRSNSLQASVAPVRRLVNWMPSVFL
jgi:endoglucanase